MASTRGGDMKGFYRQRKKAVDSKGRDASSSASASSKPKSLPNHSTTLGSDIAQPAALVSHGALDRNDDANEEVLRQFDMNMAYGPCLGMTRLGRWERANTLGLNPPKDVERLLKLAKVHAECLWDARV